MKQTIILLPCMWVLAYAHPTSEHTKRSAQSSVPLISLPLGLLQPDSALQGADVPDIRYLLPSPYGSGVKISPNSVPGWIAVPLPFGSGVKSNNPLIPLDASSITDDVEPLLAGILGSNPLGTDLIGSQSARVAVKSSKNNEKVEVNSNVGGTRVAVSTKVGATGIQSGNPTVVKTKVNGGQVADIKARVNAKVGTNSQGTKMTGTNPQGTRVSGPVNGKGVLPTGNNVPGNKNSVIGKGPVNEHRDGGHESSRS